MKIANLWVVHVSQKKRTDLEKIIRLGSEGIIDINHFERWQQFKKQWSEDDKVRWQILLNRMKKKSDGTAEFKPPLSQSEKQWVRDLIRRAEALDLLRTRISNIQLEPIA